MGNNNSGQVVGNDSNAAFLYSSGVLTALPTSFWGGAEPIGINSSRRYRRERFSVRIAAAPHPKSVIYRNGIATCLNVGPGFIVAKGINDAGVVVGEMSDFVPFIYSRKVQNLEHVGNAQGGGCPSCDNES